MRASLSSLTMRILNVAEKNDVAKNVSGILSNGNCRRREGLSKYNKIYEFEANVLRGRNKMVMTSVSGHLLEYAFVGQYKNWKSCNPSSLFEAPLEKACIANNENIKRTLQREVKSCDALIIWTDCDREGENIGFEIINVCTEVKPNLAVYRARFSDLTAQAIRSASQRLGTANKNVSDAVDVRQELDLRIGAAFTRFQTLRLQKVFPRALAEALISYGSCQFPTLGFVVERFKQVRAFVPEPFWKLNVVLEFDGDSVEFIWNRVRLFDHTACLVLHHICLENPTATVTDVRKKPKSKWRPVALDTVTLEKFASRKLHMSAKEAMTTAERLYTQGLISYPRTETNQFPKNTDLKALVQLHISSGQWGEFASKVLEWGPNPREGKKTDNAHPPIHPTKYTNDLQGKEQRVYEFIVRHFLACCSKDAEGQETIVEIDVAREKFVAQGLIVTARNYLDVYPYENWKAKIIPAFERGQTFEPSAIDMTSGQTTAPPLLTEADLIALMEKHGIGTDATHAEHIEKIKQRVYVCLTNAKHFTPGDLGMGLVEGYDAMGFAMSKPHLRAELEADLKRICDGVKSPRDVLSEQISKYRSVFEESVRQAIKLDDALARYFGQRETVIQNDVLPETPSIISKCPNCTMDLVLKTDKTRSRYFISCLGFPKCKSVLWLPDSVEGVRVTDDCSQCVPKTKKLLFHFKTGSMSLMYSNESEACLGGCDDGVLSALNVPSLRSISKRVNNFRAGRENISPTTRPESSALVPREKRKVPLRPSDGNVKCDCNETAMELTVKKQGPNTGKQFYKCRESNCGFFLWKDSSSGNSEKQKSRRIRSVVECHCSIEAKKATTQKDGPNRGRTFYACAKSGADRCNFFKWEDEDTRKKRPKIKRCTACGGAGHNKKTCPNNG